MSARACILPLVFAAACAREPARPAPRPAAQLLPTLALRAEGEVVLDLSARGDALVARPLPVPEDSDADRALSVRWLSREGARPWRFAAEPVLDARFVPGGGALLVLTTRHELLRLDAPDAAPRALDANVYGPLSLDPLGRAAVYTRGEPPELEVIRADLRDGTLRAMAPGLAPAWCPTLSDDGREVIAVASPDGAPGLWRLRDDAPPAPFAVPAGTALPTGPSAPVVFGDALVYESDGALHALGLDGTRRRTLPALGLPVRVAGAPAILAQTPQRGAVTLSPRDLEVAR